MPLRYSDNFLKKLANFYGKDSDIYRYARNGGAYLDAFIENKLKKEIESFSGEFMLKIIESEGVEKTVQMVQKMLDNRKTEQQFQTEAKKQKLEYWEKVKVDYKSK